VELAPIGTHTGSHGRAVTYRPTARARAKRRPRRLAEGVAVLEQRSRWYTRLELPYEAARTLAPRSRACTDADVSALKVRWLSSPLFRGLSAARLAILYRAVVATPRSLPAGPAEPVSGPRPLALAPPVPPAMAYRGARVAVGT
jgi:hypothetical protein